MLITPPPHLGYGALFGLVFAESAGIPLPGETALVGAGLLAGAGHMALPAVVAVGAAAAILGDNLGYWVGRRGGRRLLLRDGRLARHRRRALAKCDMFFARHGPKAVFLGRWVSGVRVVAALVAGASAMPWRRFLVYNALGAVAWAASIAGIAALLGPVAAGVLYAAGMLLAAGGGVAAATAALRRRRLRRAAVATAAP